MALPGFEFITIPSPIDLGMPKKFGDWRKDQFETVRSVALSEKPAFLLDAPPGIGKTVIAIGSYHLMHERYKKLEAVRVVLDEKEKKRFRCIFVTPTKQLQKQLTDEFPYCKTLVGRNNFPCLLRKDRWPEVTAEDCTNSKDQVCPHASGTLDHGIYADQWEHGSRYENVDFCPYQEAKRQAMASPVATLNTSYFLSEANGPGLFSHIDVLVIDECVPAGTRIATPAGDLSIENIGVGDVIWGWQNGKIIATVVEGISQRKTREPLLNTNDLLSTPRHPIWTQNRSYVSRHYLTDLDTIGLIRYTTTHEPYLQTVRPEFYSQKQESCISVLQPDMCPGISKNCSRKDLSSMPATVCCEDKKTGLLFSLVSDTLYACPTKDAANCRRKSLAGQSSPGRSRKTPGLSKIRSQSNSEEGNSTEGPGNITGSGLEEYLEWRQWDTATKGSENPVTSFGLGNRICSTDWTKGIRRQPYLLQDRCGRTSAQNSYRGRWGYTSEQEGSNGRPTKGEISARPRLADDEIYQSRNYESSGECSSSCHEGHTVYNLKTGAGNYFANDVLVHNCDTLENDLMNFVELTVSERQMRRYGIDLPMTKGMGGPLFNQQFLAVWQAWAGAQVIELGLRSDVMSGDIAQAKLWTDIEIRQSREIRQAKRLQGKLNLFAAEVTDDWVFYENQTEDGSTWTFKPAVVGDLAGKYVWRHVEDMALGMSGTILDPKRVAEDIGLGDWQYLQMPCPFPAERRPVYYKPVANLTNATMEYELPKLGREIDRIMREEAPDHKILVHTVSYRIRDYLMNFLSQKDRLMTHGSKDRADMLDEFKESNEPLVMISPSFDRGVDLPNVYQIVCKIPYMSLGDLQVQKRMSMPGGQQWYLLKAAQTIVQMTGRGMRASDNFCKSWVLDKQFMNLMSRVGTMIPDWWKKAIVRQAL